MIVILAWVGYFQLVFGNTADAEAILGLRLFRILRVCRLVFKLEVVRDVLKLAFSSAGTVLSLIGFLIFTMVLCSIIGLHLFYSCHTFDSNGISMDLDTRTGFTSFTQAFLAVMQLVTGDNFTGINLGYADCAGWAASAYFSPIYLFCNFFVLNL